MSIIRRNGRKKQISITMDSDLYRRLEEEVENREISSISHGINRCVYLAIKEQKI